MYCNKFVIIFVYLRSKVILEEDFVCLLVWKIKIIGGYDEMRKI